MRATMTPARRAVRAYTLAAMCVAASIIAGAHAVALLLTYLITGGI
jgi:hypothetical protein